MKPAIVILAAGIGSRYGGIKQLDGFGPNGERIIDYTIFDALKAGFGKVVFVIRKEIEKDFREAIMSKWENKGDFRIVFQEIDSIPKGYVVPEGRTKPWGTAHAVWMSEPEVQEPFAIVNADDFYGYQSLKYICDHLQSVDSEIEAGCMVSYELEKTLTEFGTVSRGVCESTDEGFLAEIVERTKIAKNGTGIYFEEKGEKTALAPKTPVSMNLMGFSPKVFTRISNCFDALYKQTINNVNVEYYIPFILNNLVEHGVKVPVIATNDNWFGVTYPEDKQWVSEQLNNLVQDGKYPQNIFD